MPSTSQQSPELPLEGAIPRPQDWQWAQWALKQAEIDSRNEEVAAQAKSEFTEGFYQWCFAFRSFRKAEKKIMFEGDPDHADFQIHKYLGTSLVSLGIGLIGLSDPFEKSFLEDIGFERSTTQEMIRSIEDTLEAFHSSRNQKRVGGLMTQVFGGETKANC